jgi:hypothetical protein
VTDHSVINKKCGGTTELKLCCQKAKFLYIRVIVDFLPTILPSGKIEGIAIFRNIESVRFGIVGRISSSPILQKFVRRVWAKRSDIFIYMSCDEPFEILLQMRHSSSERFFWKINY